MSNLRSGKAINKEVFEKTNNTLILIEGNEVTHYSKLEDKIDILKSWGSGESLSDCYIIFVWVGAKRSDVFKLDSEDIERLLDNKN